MKIISIFLFSILLCAGLLAGCGMNSDMQQPQTSDNTQSLDEQEAEVNPANTEDNSDTDSISSSENTNSDSGKILIAYYSATGTTKGVSERIAEITDADLFEIEPVEPYSSADLVWNDDNSRSAREWADPDLRNMELVQDSVDNWDEYDTVFIGYPIWWSIAAWPTDAFVKANDFTGKKVVTFCTASSSGIGESGDILEEMTGTGIWITGERFRSNTSNEELQKWIDSLGIIN